MEVALDVGGFPVRLADTAGIREDTSDVVEEEGIRRALQRAKESNIRVAMLDAQAMQKACPTTNGFLLKLKETYCADSDLVLVNKIDLLPGSEDKLSLLRKSEGPTGSQLLPFSTKTGEGFEEFLSQLTNSLAKA